MRIIALCPSCNYNEFKKTVIDDHKLFECLKCEDKITIDNMNFVGFLDSKMIHQVEL